MLLESIAKAAEATTKELAKEKAVTETKPATEIADLNPEYTRLINEHRRHLEKARDYERKANNLERDIQRGKEPASKMSEVRRLRSNAEREKREARRCQDLARRALQLRDEPDAAENKEADDKALDETKTPALSMDEAINRRSGKNISFGLSGCARTCVAAKVNKSEAKYS